MRQPTQKIFFPLLVFLFLAIALFSQAVDPQTAWVKRVVDGDTLLLISGERVRLIGVDTPEVHESKKLYRDVERSGETLKPSKHWGEGQEANQAGVPNNV